MGKVYLAEHPVIERKVAIKLLRRELAQDRGLVQRFFNEARAASAIHHPSIVEILDVGLLPDAQPYMIMELLEGESLTSRILRFGQLPVAEAVDITIQAAGALAAAHAKGIVHRDLKPDNLFVLPDLEGADRVHVKVLDFGIAKLRGELSGGSVKTATGTVMGTPPYMSPEQCMGVTDEIDHRTDVYAMGIILYEMLCGAPPFVSEGFGQVLMMHMTSEPLPPRSHNPAVPLALERTILDALAKRRGDRIQGMHELRERLLDPAAQTEVGVPSGGMGRALPTATRVPSAGGTTAESSPAVPATRVLVSKAPPAPPPASDHSTVWPTPPGEAAGEVDRISTIRTKAGSPKWLLIAGGVVALLAVAVAAALFLGSGADPKTGALRAVAPEALPGKEAPPAPPVPPETAAAAPQPKPPADVVQPSEAPTPLPTEGKAAEPAGKRTSAGKAGANRTAKTKGRSSDSADEGGKPATVITGEKF